MLLNDINDDIYWKTKKKHARAYKNTFFTRSIGWDKKSGAIHKMRSLMGVLMDRNDQNWENSAQKQAMRGRDPLGKGTHMPPTMAKQCYSNMADLRGTEYFCCGWLGNNLGMLSRNGMVVFTSIWTFIQGAHFVGLPLMWFLLWKDRMNICLFNFIYRFYEDGFMPNDEIIFLLYFSFCLISIVTG